VGQELSGLRFNAPALSRHKTARQERGTRLGSRTPHQRKSKRKVPFDSLRSLHTLNMLDRCSSTY